MLSKGDSVADRAGENWEVFARWHELFDALCVSQGYFDNSELATLMCKMTHSNDQAGYDSALKNLANWRRGVHVPSRKNFLAVTKIMNVADIEGLPEIWEGLYKKRRVSDAQKPDTETDGDSGGYDSGSGYIWSAIKKVHLIGAAIFVVAVSVAATIIVLMLSGDNFSAEYGALTADVEYRRSVALHLGESSVIHGARSACGERAPDWDAVAERLPDLAIGFWSDGGEGKRYSRACGGPTPARGVVFTATEPGLEQFVLYGNPVTIQVD